MNKTNLVGARAGARWGKQMMSASMVVALLAGLTACGDKEKKPGQTMVSVDGQEITVMQLNDEMGRANVAQAQQEQAKKQLLASLVDRQLLVNEAVKEKMDRDPKVVQSVERAKATILAQSYLQKRIGNLTPPTKTEIDAYFNQHPELFSQRKVFDMQQLMIATKDVTPELNKAMDGAKSLEEVATWLGAHEVKFARGQSVRSSTELPAELGKKLLAMPKGQLFIVREAERALLMTVSEIKDAPMALEDAAPQIAKYLFNTKSKEAADAELKRLRAAAKIDYSNKSDAPAATPAPAAAGAPTATPAAAAPASDTDNANARGVAGLK